MKPYPLFACILLPFFLLGQSIPYQTDFLDVRPDSAGLKILELAPIGTQIYWALEDNINYLSNGSVETTFTFRGGLGLRDGIVPLGNIGDVYYYHYHSGRKRYNFTVDARLPIPRTLDIPLLEEEGWTYTEPVMAAGKLYTVRERLNYPHPDSVTVHLLETDLSSLNTVAVVGDTVTLTEYPVTESMATDGNGLVYFTRPQSGGFGPAIYDTNDGTVTDLGALPNPALIAYERVEGRMLLRYRERATNGRTRTSLINPAGIDAALTNGSLPGQTANIGQVLVSVDTNGTLSALRYANGFEQELADLGTRTHPHPRLFKLANNDLLFYQTNATGDWMIGRTDGTPAGTREVATIEKVATDGPVQTVRLGHYVAFTSGQQPIYLYDPRNDDLQEVAGDFDRSNPTPPLAAVGDRIYFAADANGRGEQLHYLTISDQRTLGGVAFEDENGNGTRDTDEPPLPNLLLSIEGEGSKDYYYTDDNGEYAVAVRDGGTYTVTPYRPDCYTRTTTADSYTVEVPTDPHTDLDFGYTLQDGAADLNLYFTAGRVRCNTEAPFWITVRNDGCLPLAGTAKVTLPANVEFVTAYRDSAAVTDSTLTFTFDTLQPGASYHNAIKLKMPSEDFAGEPIELIGSTSATHEGGTEQTDTVRFATVLRCAVDPNDKQVFPYRFDSTGSNYTLMDETLRYHVRFENMGNDTAFAVRIEDQLSENLDWPTLVPVRASHPYDFKLGDDGLLTVSFPGIELVDSSVDRAASQGFVTFEIQAKDGLPEFTRIENTAGIYFDFNRPVITNTVVSTLVSDLDQDDDGAYFWVDCDDTNPKVYPGAREIVNNGIDDNCDGITEKTTSITNPLAGDLEVFPNPVSGQLQLRYSGTATLRARLLDLTGRQLQQTNFRGHHRMDLANYPAGVYLIRVENERTGGSQQERIVVRGR